MITRIVKLSFQPEKVKDFLEIFEASHEKIRASEGCTHLELLNDSANKNIFFTRSIWESEEYLLKYRNSALFESTWAKTKVLFSAPPEAWTTEEVISFKL